MYPVAQNLQLKLHPICEDTQAVFLSSVGIKTPSTKCPSTVLNRVLIVPSLLYCVASICSAGKEKFSESLLRRSLLRFVIASKLCACFCHNHSQTCFARNFFSPI